MSTALRHFRDLDSPAISLDSLRHILDVARTWKKHHRTRTLPPALRGFTLSMLFLRPSTRTHLSFHRAMTSLGGDVIDLRASQSQMQRGERLKDTARVLQCYSDVIVVRGTEEELQEVMNDVTIPVINGLTDKSHPCQILADIMTFEEERGVIDNATIAWLGDYNNVTCSWVQAATAWGFRLNLSVPPVLQSKIPPLPSSHIHIIDNPQDAVRTADAVVTDTWRSMGVSMPQAHIDALAPYQVNDALVSHMPRSALFMHCLPAHIGEEVTDHVFESQRSVVWKEAENRLHVQRAILAWCLDALP
ncbi:MAG: ornithine carbamoyltransferase [Alphaproteobacteria bacterium GM7ARS4]|nr:ornithine carbamoyltransferase [Alphaproteobacteria bacterium GM7ARS4]